MRIAACAVAVLLAGCECSQAGGQLAVVFESNGELITSTTAGGFTLGPVASGNTITQPIVLKNIGSASITLAGVERVSGAQVAFDAPPKADQPYRLDGFIEGFEMLPSTVKGLVLTLNAPPTQAPVLEEDVTLRVHAQSGEELQSLILVIRAEDLGAQCQVDPVLDFGVIPVGTQRSKDLRLSNPTPQSLVATLGDVHGDPELTGPAGGELELVPFQVASKSYTFSPTAPGQFTAQVSVKPSAACATVKVTLRGRAVQAWITADPSPVEFGAQAPGGLIHQRLTFTNWTGQEVTVSQLRITGEADFTVAQPQVVLPAAGQGTIDLSFSPLQMGYRTATLGYVTDLAIQPEGQVLLEGIGGGPDVEVTPGSIDFGQVPFFAGTAHGPAGAATLSIHNRGDAPLHFGTPAFSVVGQQSGDVCVGDFDPQLGCRNTVSGYDASKGIAPGETLSLPVHVVPSTGTAAGIVFSWTLDLFTDDPDQPLTVVPLSATAVQLPPCNFIVTPQAADFGVVSSPAVGNQTVTVRNNGVGSGDVCLITGVELGAGTAPGFSLPLGTTNSVMLGPGQSLDIPVQFTPRPSSQLNQQSGALTFFASSPSAPFVSVQLVATEGDGCLVLSPLQQNFGSVAVGCGAGTHSFTATNICSTPVTVLNGAFATPGDFTVVTPIPPNTQLAAGASLTFELGFHANSLGARQTGFVVTSVEQGATRTRLIALTAEGNNTGYEQDTRVQTAVGQADVLFLIDNSSSMQSLQSSIATNLAAFSQYLVDTHADVQLGVITTDLDDPNQSGRLQAAGSNPRVLSTTMPGFVTMAEQNLDVGINGSSNEHLELAIVTALSPPLSTGYNVALRRPNASFAVIELSDGAGTFDNTFVPFLKSVSSTTSYSAAKPFGTCGVLDPAADAAYVAQTGGIKVDLCQPGWGLKLSGAIQPSLQLPKTMKLVSVPDLSTGGVISVTVDGVAVSQQVWTYDATTNSVTFNGLYAPQAGQTVSFTYPVACGP
ncbi:MAG: choice-of-anchor D domain-containing protein [Myxococcaceae bacterium]